MEVLNKLDLHSELILKWLINLTAYLLFDSKNDRFTFEL